MSYKQYQILGQMLVLREFTDQDLENCTQIDRDTVRKARQRHGHLLDEVDPVRTGRPGGPLKRFRLKADAIESIRADLDRLYPAALREREQSVAVRRPQTLDIAISAIKSLETAKHSDDERDSLVERARTYLNQAGRSLSQLSGLGLPEATRWHDELAGAKTRLRALLGPPRKTETAALPFVAHVSPSLIPELQGNSPAPHRGDQRLTVGHIGETLQELDGLYRQWQERLGCLVGQFGEWRSAARPISGDFVIVVDDIRGSDVLTNRVLDTCALYQGLPAAYVDFDTLSEHNRDQFFHQLREVFSAPWAGIFRPQLALTTEYARSDTLRGLKCLLGEDLHNSSMGAGFDPLIRRIRTTLSDINVVNSPIDFAGMATAALLGTSSPALQFIVRAVLTVGLAYLSTSREDPRGRQEQNVPVQIQSLALPSPVVFDRRRHKKFEEMALNVACTYVPNAEKADIRAHLAPGFEAVLATHRAASHEVFEQAPY